MSTNEWQHAKNDENALIKNYKTEFGERIDVVHRDQDNSFELVLFSNQSGYSIVICNLIILLFQWNES